VTSTLATVAVVTVAAVTMLSAKGLDTDNAVAVSVQAAPCAAAAAGGMVPLPATRASAEQAEEMS